MGETNISVPPGLQLVPWPRGQGPGARGQGQGPWVRVRG